MIDRMLNTRWKRVVLVALVGVLTYAAQAVLDTSTVRAEGNVRYGDRGAHVVEIQEALTEGGWPVVIDGVFGFQTHGTVAMYQRANGLIIDGIVGPQTRGHLGIGRATAASPAVRVSPPTPTPPATQNSTWTRCPQWEAAAKYFGLPQRFDGIMYRESRCIPTAQNRSGATGLVQIMPMWVPKLSACGIYSVADLKDGNKNLCGAKIILDTQGINAWRATK